MGSSQHALLYETTVQQVGSIKITDECLSYVPSLQRSFHRVRDPSYTRGGRELWDPVIKSFQLDAYLQQVQHMQGVVAKSEEVLAELYFRHFEDPHPAAHSPSRSGHSPSARRSSMRASQEKLQLGLRISHFAADLVHCIATSLIRLQAQADAQVAWFPRIMCSMLVDLVDVVHLLDVLKDKKESLLISLDAEAAGSSSGVDTSTELQHLMQAQRFISSSWAVMSQLRKELENVQRERAQTTVTLAKLLEYVAASITAKDAQQLLVGKSPHVYLRALPILLNLYCSVSGAASGLVPEGMDLKLVDRCLAVVLAKPVLPGYGDATVNLVDPLMLVPFLATPIRDRDKPKVVPLSQQRDYARLEAKYSILNQMELIRQRHNELNDNIARLAFFMDSCRRRLEVPPPEVVSEALSVGMGAMLEMARWSAALLELDAWRLTLPALPASQDEEQRDVNQPPITQRNTFFDHELSLVLELLAYVKGMCSELASHFAWMEPLLHQLAYQEMQQVVAGALTQLIKPPQQQAGLTPQQQKVQDLAVALKQCIQGLQTMDAMLTPPPKKRLTRVFTNIRAKKTQQDGRLSPGPMPPSSPRQYDPQPTGGMCIAAEGAHAGTTWKSSGMMKSVSKMFKSKSETNIAEAEIEPALEILRQAPTDRHLQLLQILTEQLLHEIQMPHPKRSDAESKGLSRTIKSVAYNFNPEVSTVVVKEISAFNHLLACLDLLLLMPEVTHQVADMSDLCLSECFMEKHNLPQSSISGLAKRLMEPALDSLNVLPVDLGLIPLSLYDDTYARVRHWARQTDLPSLVALSGADYADKFLESAAAQAYEHFKAVACQHIVSCATYLYGTTASSMGFYTIPVRPCMFDNLLKQQSMELCGVKVNPREQLGYKLQLLILEDLHRLLDRFDMSKDVTILTELEFAVRLVQHTHKLLLQHLPLDGWTQTWALLDCSAYQMQPTPDEPGHKITAACLPMVLNNLLPMFLYSSHSRKFVPRVPPTPTTPSVPGSPSTPAAAIPGFPADSLSLPLWSILMGQSSGTLDQPDDALPSNPTYFGVEHILALKRMAGPKGVAALVCELKEYMKGLLENDIPNQLQQLAACLPAEVLLPSSHITTATGVFSFYNRHLAQVSTQKAIWEEPLKVLHMFGNAIALLHLISTALHVDASNNMVQVSPLLGVFAEEWEGLRRCPPSQPSFYEKLVLGNYAVQVPTMAKGALVQAERRGWRATRSMDMWPKIWADLCESVTGLESTMNALHPTSSKKTSPPKFHAVWSALLWVIIDQEITSGASRQLPYGEGPLWAGCFILHMLQQENKFKIQDFTSMLLKREQLDSSGKAAGGKAAHMHNFVSIATRVTDIWHQLCITAQRLLQPDLPSDDDEAQLPILQSCAIPRYDPPLVEGDHQAAVFNSHTGGSDTPAVSPIMAARFNNTAHRSPYTTSRLGPKPSSMLRQASTQSQHSVPVTDDFAQWRPDPITSSEHLSRTSDLDQMPDQRGPGRGFNSASVVAAFIKPHYTKPAAPEHSNLSPVPTGLSPSPSGPSRPQTAKGNAWSRVMNSMVAESSPHPATKGPSRQPALGPTLGPTQPPGPSRSLSPLPVKPFAKTMSARHK